jgi:hypothetical protein
MESMSMDKFIMFQPEMESISRVIRQIQEERTDLRGADYGDKVVLEQKQIISLGYSMGFDADIRKLNTL